MIVSDHVIHRYMQDRSHKTYFGYDIAVEPLEDGSTLRVSILPLSIGPERLPLENPATWKRLAPPRYPAPQSVRMGDTLAFDLFVNPETGQKLVEYVLFGRNHRMETVPGPARDFTIHDAEIRLRAPRLVVNGKLAEAMASVDGTISGAFVKLYWAPKGQFTFSLVPHPELGFRKLGVVRGSTAAFESGGDSYELNCEGKIAPGYSRLQPVRLARSRLQPAHSLLLTKSLNSSWALATNPDSPWQKYISWDDEGGGSRVFGWRQWTCPRPPHTPSTASLSNCSTNTASTPLSKGFVRSSTHPLWDGSRLAPGTYFPYSADW